MRVRVRVRVRDRVRVAHDAPYAQGLGGELGLSVVHLGRVRARVRFRARVWARARVCGRFRVRVRVSVVHQG